MDNCDTNSIGIDLSAQAVGDRADGVLGRRELPDARICRFASTRVDEDYLPLALAQLREAGPSERVRREHVHFDLFSELIFGRFVDPPEVDDPGIVDEDVEASALRCHRVDQRGACDGIGEVGGEWATTGTHMRGCTFEGICRTCHHPDGHAGISKRERDRRSDSLARTRNEGDASAEIRRHPPSGRGWVLGDARPARMSQVS
jgi:hypothetical protein